MTSMVVAATWLLCGAVGVVGQYSITRIDPLSHLQPVLVTRTATERIICPNNTRVSVVSDKNANSKPITNTWGES